MALVALQRNIDVLLREELQCLLIQLVTQLYDISNIKIIRVALVVDIVAEKLHLFEQKQVLSAVEKARTVGGCDNISIVGQRF